MQEKIKKRENWMRWRTEYKFNEEESRPSIEYDINDELDQQEKDEEEVNYDGLVELFAEEEIVEENPGTIIIFPSDWEELDHIPINSLAHNYADLAVEDAIDIVVAAALEAAVKEADVAVTA